MISSRDSEAFDPTNPILSQLQAIETIKRNPDWGAVTVYGDTDSLFVHLEGKTKDEAFKIGNEIAEVVTSQNPHPVRLKFEKVSPLFRFSQVIIRSSSDVSSFFFTS